MYVYASVCFPREKTVQSKLEFGSDKQMNKPVRTFRRETFRTRQ